MHVHRNRHPAPDHHSGHHPHLRKRRRPSPATVIACLALVGAWGGPAFADTFITGADVRDASLTGRDIKNKSLTGRDLKSNTITGRNVKGLSGRDILPDTIDGWNIFEGGLGEVPRAAQAREAETSAHAAVADRLSGQGGSGAPLRLAVNLAPGAEQQVLDTGGLRIRVRCTGAGQVEAMASTATNGALVRASVVRGGQAAAYAEDDDFRIGDAFNLLPSGRSNVAGMLLYATSANALVSLDYFADEGVTALTPGGGCVFGGHAITSNG
jgi:uncharacterized protein YjbI with pentapeptide repeats